MPEAPIESLALRVWEQHAQLERVYGKVAQALVAGDGDLAQRLLATLQSQLDDHFSLEEGAYFPLLLELKPGHKASVRRLRFEHTGFREEIEQILKRISVAEFESAGARFDRLAAKLATHDAHEESLMRAAS